MNKNIIISFMTAELLMQHPWYVECAGGERIALIVGIAAAVFIFLLFLEDLWDKYRKYRRRVQKVRKIVKKLRYQGMGGNHGR